MSRAELSRACTTSASERASLLSRIARVGARSPRRVHARWSHRARAAAAAFDAFDALVREEATRGTSAAIDVIDIGGIEPSSDGSRLVGVVARRDIPRETRVLERALDAPAYDAEYARADDGFGLASALKRHESEVQRRVSDDVAMGLMLAFAARHPERSPLGAYARALPRDAARTPALCDDDELEALVPMLSLHLVDQIDIARREFALAYDDARAVVREMESEVELAEDEFAWAWSMVRSRAITFAVRQAASGEVVRKRCLVPVCDILNHSPSSATNGPNVRIEATASGSSWVTTRDVAAGDALRWTYGELSNEEMWLWYGFVPSNPVHDDCSVVFNLPDAVFLNGLNAVAKDDRAETGALRRELLKRAGALGLNEGEELSFVINMRGPPTVLGGIAGIMCCDADEVVAIAASTVISANGGVDGDLFELKPESRRRAGRYVAWLLTQVEAFVCGATDAEVEEYERTALAVGGEHEERFKITKALRAGAKATFSAMQRQLAEDVLLSPRGAWIDDATKRLVATARSEG